MDETKKTSRLGLAASLGVLGHLAALIAGLWATPQLLFGLGAAAYGALAIVSSFTAYFFYLELGLGGAYIRALSVAIGKGDTERAQRLFETAHSLYLRIGIAGAALMALIGLPYLARTSGDEVLVYQVWACILATAVMLFASMALSASRGLIFAMQRADLYSGLTLLFQPGIPLLQVAAVWAGLGILGVMGVQLLGNLSVDLLLRQRALRLMPSIQHRAKFYPEIWSELRGFSLYRFVTQLAQQGQWTGDRLLLGAMLPSSRVSVYALSASIAQRLRIFAGVVNAPFFPAASEQFAQGGLEGLAEICATYWRRCSVFLALASAGAIFLAQPFLLFWVGPPYSEEGAPILRLMVLSTSALTLAGLVGLATDAGGVPRASALASIFGVLASLAVGASLVVWYGPFGAAIGFTVGACVQLCLSVVSLGALMGLRRVASMLSGSLLAPALIGVLAFVVMSALPFSGGLSASLLASVVGSLVATLIALFSGVIRRDEIPARIRRLWPWKGGAPK